MPDAPHLPSIAGRRRWLGTLIAIALLALLGALAWYLTSRSAPNPGPPGATARGPGGAGPAGRPGGFGGPLPSTVALATARKADVPVLLDSLGTVTPVATVTVRPQVSGVLTRVLFTEGQMVARGQLLAQIDPRPFELALMQASGTRQRDEAQLQNAQLTLERYRTLLQQDSIARQDVDTQAALVKQLEGTVMTDRANEGTARLNLGYTRIVAPVAGRVGLRTVDAGNLVGTSDANGVAVITQLTPIDVEFTVAQDRVHEVLQRLAAGTLPARALDSTRSTVLDEGRFSALDNQIDTTTGTVKGKARFANTKGLLFPNQFVNLQLELNTITGAVVVPLTALRNGPKGDFVYVLEPDKTVRQRSVKRGQASAERVVIASGLSEGEQVVTEGADRLKDGASVQLAADVAASAPARAGSRPWRGASGSPGAAGAWGGGASRPRRAERTASAAAGS
ncbi:MAG: efflux RND transporter periplasmic adaptor subunit [Ideonella sp.]|nr:efflux RND transporter periplasmic adaptor subunit [Ideonella sp.]MCC7457462.1 efflux RND transporter periplasmic adaptor subunit [Nitrospira sp.]